MCAAFEFEQDFLSYSVRSGKQLQITKHGYDISVEHLVQMSEKPAIVIPVYHWTENIPDPRKKILSGALSGTIPAAIATSFIYEKLPELKARLTQNWTSYSLKIGDRDQEITPLDLFKPIPVQTHFRGEIPQGVVELSDMAILAKCLMPYRLAQAPPNQQLYQKELTSKMLQVFSSEPFNLDSAPGVLAASHWVADATYCSLVAAIDMFLKNFPRHPYERLRVCTLVSNFRDCVIISSVAQTSRALGLTPGVLFQYILNQDVAEEAERVYTGSEGEEKLKENSYFQYMRDFQLVSRSPYSASASPNFFTWCHIIGALSGKKRSMYARYVDCSNPNILIVEGAYIVALLGAGSKMDIQFAGSLESAQKVKMELDMNKAMGIPGQGTVTPLFILQKIRENNFQITAEIADKLRPIINTIDGGRPNTIGELIVKYFEKL